MHSRPLCFALLALIAGGCVCARRTCPPPSCRVAQAFPAIASGSVPGAGSRPEVPASIGGVTETLNGHIVRDPFRGLEDRAGATPWIDAHTAAADAWFAAHPDEALDKRLLELSRLGGVGAPRVAGEKTFFT